MTRNSVLNKTMRVFSEDSNLNNVFCFNEFTGDVEFTTSPEWARHIRKGDFLSDEDISHIRYYISRVHNFEPNKTIVGEVSYLTSRENSYHPVKKYIEKEKWDGKLRLNTWLKEAIGCDDNIYTRMVGAKFLIAAVNRIYNPGCKFDHMMILEGDQGIGKSTLVEELAGNWYLDTNFDNKEKELIDIMRTAFIVEISELSGMTRKDVDWLKAFLTKKVDRARLAYAQRSKDFKRKSVFIGTYNPSGNNSYLTDDTGNRRFWCVECNHINIDYVRKNKHQLWAEAYLRYQDQEQYFITDPDAIKIMLNMHQDREMYSPTHIDIQNWLSTKHGRVYVTIHEVIEEGMGIILRGKPPKETRSLHTIAGIILKKLKWKKGNNDNKHKYYNPEYKEKEKQEEDVWNLAGK